MYRLNERIEMIKECKNSGKTIKDWCAERGIKTQSYYYWLRYVRKAASEALPTTVKKSSIIPVDICATHDKTTFAGQEQSSITISIASISLHISNSASYELIENTLKAVQHVR